MDAYWGLTAGNVWVRYVLIGMHQRDHSEMIALIKKSIGCVGMMLLMMRSVTDEYLRNDHGRECRRDVYLHWNASMRPFRVDCPHQNVCAMRGCGAADDGVSYRWIPTKER